MATFQRVGNEPSSLFIYMCQLYFAQDFSLLYLKKKLSLQIFLNIFNENRVFANFHNLFQFMLMVSSGRLGSANVFRFFLLSTPRHVIWQIFYEHFQKFSQRALKIATIFGYKCGIHRNEEKIFHGNLLMVFLHLVIGSCNEINFIRAEIILHQRG